MNTPISKARRSEDFDELLWQITGELALSPASASLAAAPFIDLEPDPEPHARVDRIDESAPASATPHSGPRVPHFLLAAAAAIALSFGAFSLGQGTSGPAIVTAMELHDAPEHSAVLAVAHGPSTRIPVAEFAERPNAETPEPEPKVEAKPKTKRKYTRKAKTKAKPKPKSVAFEDL